MKRIWGLAWLILMATPVFSHEQSEPGGCVPIDRAGYLITKPGNYCFTKDLYTRLDFPDHRAEGAIVEIRSSDVMIDMRGYTAGRGRIFTQHGGNGFKIENARSTAPRYMNIVIKNGTLMDFDWRVYYYASKFGYPTLPRQVK